MAGRWFVHDFDPRTEQVVRTQISIIKQWEGEEKRTDEPATLPPMRNKTRQETRKLRRGHDMGLWHLKASWQLEDGQPAKMRLSMPVREKT